MKATGTRERNREETTARILGAVGEVLARDGFGGIGINAIARQAGVDKVLIYRYFGGLPKLLEAWGRSGRFWPSVDELLGDDPAAFLALPLAERYARFFEHFVAGLRARPLTLEIMAAEVQERNALTAILETEREQWGEEVARLLGGEEAQSAAWLNGVSLLMVAGVQYLLLRSRSIRIFGGVELRTDEGWAALMRSVRALAEQTFGAPAPPPQVSPARAARKTAR